MRKFHYICLLFALFIGFSVHAQSNSQVDLFAGKWEITVLGTPQGDSKLIAELTRSGGKLTGQLTNQVDPSEKIPVTVEENGDKIALYFTSQSYDVTIDLTKVDQDNLKGTLLNMFEANAKRIK